MRLAEGDSEDKPDRDDVVWDLMCGLGPYHIHSLCVNDMGMGFTPKQIGAMTLDMIFMLLADKKILRKSGKKRSAKKMFPAIGEDGIVKGRAEDGTAIEGRITGKSLARRLMEEEEQKKLQGPESAWQKRARKRAERRNKRNR